MTGSIDIAERNYVGQGWCEIDLPDGAQIAEISGALTSDLKSLTGHPEAELGQYHHYVSDEDHDRIHWALAERMWSWNIGVEIGRRQYEFLRGFIGPDLMAQAKPFLRIARPGREADNIGFHRDTIYGQSPYEVTMFIPLVDLPEAAAILVIPKSHTDNGTTLKFKNLARSDWKKGSKKHRLGFPYAPKQLDPEAADRCRAVPLAAGQAMLFSPSLIHGQVRNDSGITRVSIDVRFLNANAPIDVRRDENERGYKPVAVSAVEKVASKFLAHGTL